MRSRMTLNCRLSKHERFAVKEVQMGTKMSETLVIQNSVCFDKRSSEKYVNKAHRLIIRSFIESFVHSFINSFILTYIYLFILSQIHSFILTQRCRDISAWIYRIVYHLFNDEHDHFRQALRKSCNRLWRNSRTGRVWLGRLSRSCGIRRYSRAEAGTLQSRSKKIPPSTLLSASCCRHLC